MAERLMASALPPQPGSRAPRERHFSSGKHSRLMDQHRYFNIFQMSLHVALSVLTYLATALAHLQADDYAHMRHMRIKLPKARRTELHNRQSRPAETLVVPATVDGATLRSASPTGHQNGWNSTVSLHLAM